MSKRRLPPSQRGDKIPDIVVKLVVDLILVSPDMAKHREKLIGESETLRAAARERIMRGEVTYRQDKKGVYHVTLPGVEEPFMLPPPDFPQGHPHLEALKAYVRGRRSEFGLKLIEAIEHDEDGLREIHLALAMELMADDQGQVRAAEVQQLYFLGWDDEESDLRLDPERN